MRKLVRSSIGIVSLVIIGIGVKAYGLSMESIGTDMATLSWLLGIGLIILGLGGIIHSILNWNND